VTPDVWYVAGSGLLVGADQRWLLLDDAPDESFVATLWETITGSGVDKVLALLDDHYGATIPSLAMTSSGREVTRGTGQVTTDRIGVMLSLGPASSSATTGQRRPFRGGVVSAALVEIPAEVVQSAGEDGLIDSVPEDILAAVGPDVPARTHRTAPIPPPPEEVTQTGSRLEPVDAELAAQLAGPAAGDPDHLAVVRSSGTDAPPQPVPEPEMELLREHTHETVMASYCPEGHVNPPYAPTCRVCQVAIPRQEPQRAPRPLLGRLRLPTGETVPLDRGVVLGRKPVPVTSQPPQPHLIAVPQESGFVSRMHLQIELDGWLVICRDLGSRGGTTLRMPSRPPERLRAMEPHVLEPGCRVSLADQYEVVYEVGT